MKTTINIRYVVTLTISTIWIISTVLKQAAQASIFDRAFFLLYCAQTSIHASVLPVMQVDCCCMEDSVNMALSSGTEDSVKSVIKRSKSRIAFIKKIEGNTIRFTISIKPTQEHVYRFRALGLPVTLPENSRTCGCNFRTLIKIRSVYTRLVNCIEHHMNFYSAYWLSANAHGSIILCRP